MNNVSDIKAVPRISIGLPVYNGASHLDAVLKNILAQTYTDFELIISDNASTDTTKEICQNFAKQDPRIRVYRQSQNIGMWPNFIFVFDQAQSPYFMWAAHDDVRDPKFISELIKVLETDVSCGIAFCEYDCLLVKKGLPAKRQLFPNMTEMLSMNIVPQLAAFILMDEYTLKANFYYGIWRRHLLEECMTYFRDKAFLTETALDVILITQAMTKTKIVQIPKLLFSKVYGHYLVGSGSSTLRRYKNFFTKPFFTLKKSVNGLIMQTRYLRYVLENANVMNRKLSAILLLKKIFFFLPMYRFLTSYKTTLLFVRLFFKQT